MNTQTVLLIISDLPWEIQSKFLFHRDNYIRQIQKCKKKSSTVKVESSVGAQTFAWTLDKGKGKVVVCNYAVHAN